MYITALKEASTKYKTKQQNVNKVNECIWKVLEWILNTTKSITALKQASTKYKTKQQNLIKQTR